MKKLSIIYVSFFLLLAMCFIPLKLLGDLENYWISIPLIILDALLFALFIDNEFKVVCYFKIRRKTAKEKWNITEEHIQRLLGEQEFLKSAFPDRFPEIIRHLREYLVKEGVSPQVIERLTANKIAPNC